MNPAAALAPEATIAVIGAGRLGGVLARALRAAGFDVRGPMRRGEEIPAVDLAILCVPDAAIPEAVAAARRSAGLLAHVSGSTGLDDVDLSIHPLQTFTGAESADVFHGIGAAVDGRTADDTALAERLARALGMTSFAVADRATYHAAASVASNLVLTVLDAAEQLAAAAGVESPRDVLAPLVRQTVENWADSGAADALTGPIARGDEGTVARQRAAVHTAAPHLDALFGELVTATRALAQKAGASASLHSVIEETV